MKKIIRLTESDLTRLIKRVINEQKSQGGYPFGERIPTTKVGPKPQTKIGMPIPTPTIQTGQTMFPIKAKLFSDAGRTKVASRIDITNASKIGRAHV